MNTTHPFRALDGEIPELLHHQAESAARHLVRRIALADAHETVQAVLARLSGHKFEVLDAIYVVDERHILKGLVRLHDFFSFAAERRLSEVMDADPPVAHPNLDQEHIALLAIKHDLTAVPVVDERGKLLGVVPAQALIRILRREHIEDMHRLAGIHAQEAQVHEAFEASPAHRLRDRFPWLLVGLLGSVLATLVMAGFEDVLKARIAIAFFVPAIVYLADAIGTQTETITVRFLSHNHAPLHRLLMGEVVAGLLIGLSLAALAFPAILLSFGDHRLALAVSTAVLGAGVCATTIGLVLPCLLRRAGVDPAFGSGPVATIIQDVLSILIYFGMVRVFVA
jgi:magnesium transporter